MKALKLTGLLATTGLALALAAPAAAQQQKLVIESWRNDDLAIWQEKIIPAFNKAHPNITVEFSPTAPKDYNAALNAKLASGTAGDIITCRPFDASLGLFQKGYLTPLSDLKGIENFPDTAKVAWTTDDGKTTFCLPMASVIHGFIYNADAFQELGIQPPKTESEFFAALEKIRADGRYTPLAMGTSEQWEAATMGFQNVGPNYWQGEAGRTKLIKGQAKLTDAEYVKTFEQIAKWKPYLPKGFEAQTYADSQNMFTLGRAVIYPAGSWEIALFNQQADFKMGAFLPPKPDNAQECYISDHTDIGMGINKASKNQDAARTFLEWAATKEFAEIYANELPGFFSLSKHEVALKDPLAQEFVNWRKQCKSTIRNSYQILSRGEPNLENEMWATSARVVSGTLSPQDAAKQLQAGLDKWYKPAP